MLWGSHNALWYDVLKKTLFRCGLTTKETLISKFLRVANKGV